MSIRTSLHDGLGVIATNELGQIIQAYGGTNPSGVPGYLPACLFQNTTDGKLYRNSGSVTSCTFTEVGDA